MHRKKIIRISLELILLVFLLMVFLGPISSLFIWSVAETWYWPNPLPQETGFQYWLQALGLQSLDQRPEDDG